MSNNQAPALEGSDVYLVPMISVVAGVVGTGAFALLHAAGELGGTEVIAAWAGMMLGITLRGLRLSFQEVIRRV